MRSDSDSSCVSNDAGTLKQALRRARNARATPVDDIVLGEGLLRLAELLAGASHAATTAARALRHDRKTYQRLDQADLPHDVIRRDVDPYTMLLRSIAACRALLKQADDEWDDSVMGGVLEEVELRQRLDWLALMRRAEDGVVFEEEEDDDQDD